MALNKNTLLCQALSNILTWFSSINYFCLVKKKTFFIHFHISFFQSGSNDCQLINAFNGCLTQFIAISKSFTCKYFLIIEKLPIALTPAVSFLILPYMTYREIEHETKLASGPNRHNFAICLNVFQSNASFFHFNCTLYLRKKIKQQVLFFKTVFVSK